MLSVIGVGTLADPFSAGVAWALSSANKVIYKMILNKYKNYKTQYEKDNQTKLSFEN